MSVSHGSPLGKCPGEGALPHLGLPESYPKQGLEMEAIVPHKVGVLEYFCCRQGQDFQLAAAPLHPNMSQVPAPRRNEMQLG